MSSTTERLVQLLSEGVDVTLQADLDLVVNSPVVENNAAGAGAPGTGFQRRSHELRD